MASEPAPALSPDLRSLTEKARRCNQRREFSTFLGGPQFTGTVQSVHNAFLPVPIAGNFVRPEI